jgi:MarR family transcriptional regulator, organic hydroperoxide resistance regulator
VGTRTEEDLLDLEILDAVAGLFAHLVAEGDELAKTFGIPAFVMKALHMLDAPLAMKDLGRRMNCDPSFITGIADTLERHGLAAREPDPGDRRVKRLVLTPAGAELKHRVEDEILARTPWRRSLSRDERASLLALARKMSPPLSATEVDCPFNEAEGPDKEVSELLTTAAPLAAQPARQKARDEAPAPAAR